MLKKLFDFFVFSSLFIAFCAVLMTYQTCLLFQLPFNFILAGFVFSGTVCSYNFHWYLTPPESEKLTRKLAWNISNRNLHLFLFILGAIASLIFSVLLIEHWFWLGITAFVTFLYSAPKIPLSPFSWLKKIAVGKTIFLALAWTHVTTLLPHVISSEKFGTSIAWFMINRFFFIYAICILFDFRDLEEDRKSGIKSLITLFSEKNIDNLFWFSILVFLVSLAALYPFFSWISLLALLIPGTILSLLYYPSKKNFSDYHYYFILDGLMMLSAPLLLLIKFAR